MAVETVAWGPVQGRSGDGEEGAQQCVWRSLAIGIILRTKIHVENGQLVEHLYSVCEYTGLDASPCLPQ